jgi:hypothetical protein
MKARIKELKEQQQQLELELDLIGEAAVEYARSRAITTISGSEYMLKISAGKGYQFLRSQEEGREELETFIRKSGMWEPLSMLNIRRLEKIIDEDLDSRIKSGLLTFAEDTDKVSVRLVKKRAEEE